MLHSVDYLTIGHVSRDLLPDGKSRWGGTALYAALTAAMLGRRAGILTAYAPQDALNIPGVAIQRVDSTATTTFENFHDAEGRRTQKVHAVAAPLSPEHLPANWQAPAIVHIAPVMNECAPAWPDVFPEGTFVGITPQGWLRTHDKQGYVHPRSWEAAAQVLPKASAVVVSLEDLGGSWEQAWTFASLTPLLVVTQAADGGTLFIKGEPLPFPARDVADVDTVGAGDIFAAAFFVALTENAPPLAAVGFAACLAAHSVTRRGLAGIPRPEEVRVCRKRLAE